MNLLVLNAGSSTLKFTLFAADDLAERADGTVDWQGGGQATIAMRIAGEQTTRTALAVADYSAAVAQVLTLLDPIAPRSTIRAVGHRVVHGGAALQASVPIDAGVKQTLRDLCALAPLHNPPALETIDAAEAALPGTPQVAVFDTAFFSTLTPDAFVYPLPYAWYEQWGIRRFGFHGISHHYCSLRAAQMLGRSDLRLVICHLGNGCSASAVKNGRAVDVTMGFTPLEGLMMGTRCGSVDPSILLYVLHKKLVDADQLEQALNRQSGLLGVSGVSGDFREVTQAAQSGNERARLALTIYARRIRAAIAGLAVTLGGIDALIFTAGVGENSAALRAEVCQGLECLGLFIDEDINPRCDPDDHDIAFLISPARILILHTREDWLIAKETQRTLQAPG